MSSLEAKYLHVRGKKKRERRGREGHRVWRSLRRSEMVYVRLNSNRPRQQGMLLHAGTIANLDDRARGAMLMMGAAKLSIAWGGTDSVTL